MTTRSPSERRAAPPQAARLRYPLAPTRALTLETVASRSGLHPDLVRRFVALSLLDATRDARGELLFPLDTPATIARIQRLRAGLCLNYAAIGLVLDLLDHIDALEAALRGSAATAQRRRDDRRSLPPAEGVQSSAARSEPPWT